MEQLHIFTVYLKITEIAPGILLKYDILHKMPKAGLFQHSSQFSLKKPWGQPHTEHLTGAQSP
ncbi:hypothetical protein F320042A7_37300 [Blautia producta]